MALDGRPAGLIWTKLMSPYKSIRTLLTEAKLSKQQSIMLDKEGGAHPYAVNYSLGAWEMPPLHTVQLVLISEKYTLLGRR